MNISPSTPPSNQPVQTQGNSNAVQGNKTNPNQNVLGTDEKEYYTDLVLELMQNASELQTNELDSAREQIQIVKNKIEEFRKKLEEQRKLLAEQARRKQEAAKRDEIFGAIADAFTIMAAAIAVAFAPNPLTIALLVLAVTQVALQRTDAVYHIAKACGASDKEASDAQLGVSIALAVIGVVASGVAFKIAGTATTGVLKAVGATKQAAEVGEKIARFQKITQAAIMASNGLSQAGKGATKTELASREYDHTKCVVDKEQMQAVMDCFDAIAKKDIDELDEREKEILAMVEIFMDIIDKLLKVVEEMSEELQKKLA